MQIGGQVQPKLTRKEATWQLFAAAKPSPETGPGTDLITGRVHCLIVPRHFVPDAVQHGPFELQIGPHGRLSSPTVPRFSRATFVLSTGGGSSSLRPLPSSVGATATVHELPANTGGRLWWSGSPSRCPVPYHRRGKAEDLASSGNGSCGQVAGLPVAEAKELLWRSRPGSCG